MSYSVLILEDEHHAYETLVHMMADFPEFTIVGHATNLDTGRKLLAEYKPDLLLSDVMLPPHTSFDLLNTLTSIPFDIIFITSFETFAIKAFKLAAVDYLLKPIVKEDLGIALQRFKDKRTESSSIKHIQQLLSNLSRPVNEARIALPTFTGFLFVNVKDIVRCESDNTYTTFYMSDKKKVVVSRTLKDCEALLADYRFFRVHNSHLINLDFVTEYIRGEGGIVKLADGSQVDVSRRRKDEFLLALKQR